MKKTLLLIGGLAFAGVALASDPAPQSTSTGTSLKVGIDANGKLRPLTPSESAALDAQATQNAGSNNSLRAGAAGRSTLSKKAQSRYALPTTQAEVDATKRVVNGITVMKPMADSMSELTVTRNADGTLSIQENGETHAAKAPEAGNE